jgi:hypothetical protein
VGGWPISRKQLRITAHTFLANKIDKECKQEAKDEMRADTSLLLCTRAHSRVFLPHFNRNDAPQARKWRCANRDHSLAPHAPFPFGPKRGLIRGVAIIWHAGLR